MKQPEIKIPKMGKRIVKSAAAVFLCFLIYAVFRRNGILFYSQLAALWCIQPQRANMISKAWQRMVGTFTGAVFGLVVLLADKHLLMGLQEHTAELLYAVVVSVMIAFVLYFTVLIHKKDASYFSCVVLLSIVVNHIGDANPYIFVLNRVLDTIIGIGVGMLVNSLQLPRRKEKDILFVSGMDGALLEYNDRLSAYSVVELNRMLQDGANFTVSTKRTPASLMDALRNVNLRLPVIAMDGAVIYDLKTNEYLHAYVISTGMARRLQEFLDGFSINYFINVIVEHMLVIQYRELKNEAEKDIYDRLHTSPYRNYTTKELLEDAQCIYFMLVDKKEQTERIYQALKESEFDRKLRIDMYDSDDYPGYVYIKIYNRNATRENMIEYLKRETGLKKTVTFGSVKDQYDVVVREYDPDKVVSTLERMYEPLWWPLKK